MTLLLICKVPFTFFELKNDVETSYNFFASFYLKIFFIAVVIVTVIFGYPRQFTGNPRHPPIRLSRKREKPSRPAKKFSTGKKILGTREQISKDHYQIWKGKFV